MSYKKIIKFSTVLIAITLVSCGTTKNKGKNEYPTQFEVKAVHQKDYYYDGNIFISVFDATNKLPLDSTTIYIYKDTLLSSLQLKDSNRGAFWTEDSNVNIKVEHSKYYTGSIELFRMHRDSAYMVDILLIKKERQ